MADMWKVPVQRTGPKGSAWLGTAVCRVCTGEGL